MGYELSICRAASETKISIEEWRSYVDTDPEFEPLEEMNIELPNGKTLNMKLPHSGLWKKNKKEVPFTYDLEFGISVKSPDNETIGKMIEVAKSLNALVAGEEAEVYDEAYLAKQAFVEASAKPIPVKKWWQFWKNA